MSVIPNFTEEDRLDMENVKLCTLAAIIKRLSCRAISASTERLDTNVMRNFLDNGSNGSVLQLCFKILFCIDELPAACYRTVAASAVFGLTQCTQHKQRNAKRR